VPQHTKNRCCAELAHDVNNLLTVILGYCDLLDQQNPHQTELTAQIRNATHSAKRLSETALGTTQPPTPLDLNQAVERAKSLLTPSLNPEIKIETHLTPNPLILEARPADLDQILLNLVTNARDAMPHGGTITLKTRQIKNQLELTVTDTGTGMDPSTQARIFEPLFTTKSTGQGTGLGLSIVAAIVERAGWAITVNSTPNQGTTFALAFPRYEQQPSKQGKETILLVEDSEPLRKLTTRLLTDCGYHVLEAASALEAIAIAHIYHGTISLLITDLSLPGASGRVLAQQLAQPRALYISGYHDHQLDQDCAFLQKPFTRDDLLKRVRDLLDAPLPARRVAIPPKTTYQSSTSRHSARRLVG
jgi:two-component system, cell cycle sensor histidine kinase and response regulator CckA